MRAMYHQTPKHDGGMTRVSSLTTTTAPAVSTSAVLDVHRREPDDCSTRCSSWFGCFRCAESIRREMVCASLAAIAALVVLAWGLSVNSIFALCTRESKGFSAVGAHSFLLEFMMLVYIWLTYSLAFIVYMVESMVSIELFSGGRRSPGDIWRLKLYRRTLLVISRCLLLVLIFGHIDALGYQNNIRSRESEFRDEFNKYFCHSRITQLCSDGGQYSKLLDMFDTESAESEPESERVWHYCEMLLTTHEGFISSKQQEVLDSCNFSDSVDSWCGNYTMGFSVDVSSPMSPFSMNPRRFLVLQMRWSIRVWLDSLYLGIVLLCAFVTCFLMRNVEVGQRRSRSSGFGRYHA